jgi:hypothetical protein
VFAGRRRISALISASAGLSDYWCFALLPAECGVGSALPEIPVRVGVFLCHSPTACLSVRWSAASGADRTGLDAAAEAIHGFTVYCHYSRPGVNTKELHVVNMAEVTAVPILNCFCDFPTAYMVR